MKRMQVILVVVFAVLTILALGTFNKKSELYQAVADPNPMRFHGKQMEKLQQEEIQIVQADAHKQYVRK